jgi:hypothetical protein
MVFFARYQEERMTDGDVSWWEQIPDTHVTLGDGLHTMDEVIEVLKRR